MSDEQPSLKFDRAGWMDAGACNGTDTNLFFPNRGQDAEQPKTRVNNVYE